MQRSVSSNRTGASANKLKTREILRKLKHGVSSAFLFHRALSMMIFCVILFQFTINSFSQIIDNRQGNAFKDEMFFSQQFLWLNKVKSISGVKSIKRPNRPIEQRPDVVVYRFNEVGLLQSLDRVSSVLNLVDSLTIEFKRNDLGEVELKKENGTRGYFTTQFNYDDRGRLIRLDYGKAENVAQEKGKLMPGQVITINSESFTWSDAEKGIVKKGNFNNYGLHYSNWMIMRNDLGYIENEVEELIMSGRTTNRKYMYNEHGWIDRIETTDNLNSTGKVQTFIYDTLGNLLKVEYFEGKTLSREVEVLYNSTMLIEAFLDHNLQSHDIEITKFTYEFYK